MGIGRDGRHTAKSKKTKRTTTPNKRSTATELARITKQKEKTMATSRATAQDLQKLAVDY